MLYLSCLIDNFLKKFIYFNINNECLISHTEFYQYLLTLEVISFGNFEVKFSISDNDGLYSCYRDKVTHLINKAFDILR